MEFPPSDPPPSTFVPVLNYAPSVNYAPPVSYAPVPNYTESAAYDSHQPLVPSFNHPSYQEMISSAIIALNEKDGSSRQAIAKYIDNNFQIVPSQAHSYELTQQLKRMKNTGQLVLVKHSYMFPRSLPMTMPMPAVSVNGPAGYDGMSQGGQGQVSDGLKKRPGRPPKLQPNGGLMGSSGQPVVLGFENQHQQAGGVGFGVPTTNLFGGLNSGEFQFVGENVNNNVTPPVSNLVNVPVTDAPTIVHNGGPMYDPGAVANVVPIEQTDVVPTKRGRGRPRKVHTSVVEVESGALVSSGEDAVAQNNVGDGPPVVTPPTVLGKRRRGRPAKLNTRPVVNGGAKEGQGGQAMVLAGKRGRGRPRKDAVGAVPANGANAGGVLPVAKKPRKVSGKPVGRPRKNVSQAASSMSEIQLMAYEGLKARVEHYQSRIKTAVSVVKPYLNETAVIALGALQDLEELADMDIISVPPSVQGAPADVQSAPVNVLSAPVDLNAPVNVQGTAPENIRSAPLTAEAVPVTFQSVPSTGEPTQSAFQSAPVSVQGQ